MHTPSRRSCFACGPLAWKGGLHEEHEEPIAVADLRPPRRERGILRRTRSRAQVDSSLLRIVFLQRRYHTLHDLIDLPWRDLGGSFYALTDRALQSLGFYGITSSEPLLGRPTGRSRWS